MIIVNIFGLILELVANMCASSFDGLVLASLYEEMQWLYFIILSVELLAVVWESSGLFEN